MTGRLRRRLTLTAATAATCLVTGLLAPPATAARLAPTPGSPGIGDSYYPGAGNGGYDVQHYDIRLTYQPGTDLLAGGTTILATATQDLSRFNLDFGLKTKSVRVNNAPAQFAKDAADASELVVTPAKPLAKGQSMLIVVNYEDVPSSVVIDGFTGWKKTPDGALAVDEPAIAEWWYPSNDHPTDKATFDVSLEVPDDVAAISNGSLLRKRKQRAGWTRWEYRSTQPQITYLTFMAVGKFEVNQSTTPSGQPFLSAYDPGLGDRLPAAKASIERTPEVTDYLATQFGPYPFEAQGGVASTGLGFALENQTRPVYSTNFFRSGANYSVVVHEMAHQWFGDSVGVGRWSEIWLNEGFATYAEFLWSEYQGEGTADELAGYIYDTIPADDPFWQVLPGNPGPENQFHDAVYDRGAMAVNVLRNEVGDQAFFQILQTWLAQKKGSTGTIPEFIALAERISGKPLYGLFQTWLYTKGKPAQRPDGAATARTLGAPVQPKSYPQIKLTHELLGAHGH